MIKKIAILALCATYLSACTTTASTWMQPRLGPSTKLVSEPPCGFQPQNGLIN